MFQFEEFEEYLGATFSQLFQHNFPITLTESDEEKIANLGLDEQGTEDERRIKKLEIMQSHIQGRARMMAISLLKKEDTFQKYFEYSDNRLTASGATRPALVVISRVKVSQKTKSQTTAISRGKQFPSVGGNKRKPRSDTNLGGPSESGTKKMKSSVTDGALPIANDGVHALTSPRSFTSSAWARQRPWRPAWPRDAVGSMGTY